MLLYLGYRNSRCTQIVWVYWLFLWNAKYLTLRRHLKTHSGEKSFKCNQRDSHLFTQTITENIWKLTLEKSHWIATNATMNLFWQAIWEDIWKLTLKKYRFMQPMRLRNCSLRRFEETFENSHWRKVIQMQPMWLCICSGRQLEKTFENSLWKKSRKSATNVTMHLFKHAVWQHLKTHSREQMQPMQLCICSGRHFEKTFENSLRRKIVQMQPMRLWISSGRQCQKTLENSLLSTACPSSSFHPQWWEDTSLWELFEPSRRSEKAPPHSHWRKTLQMRKMQVLKCWIIWPQYWRLSVWSDPLRKAVLKL